VTTQDYPQRLVFPPPDVGAVVGLLANIGAAGASVPVPTADASGVTVFSQPSRVLQELERVCADHEDARANDPVLRVQSEVDEVRGLMRDNIDTVLVNADKLHELKNKADTLSGISQGFYGNARAQRRKQQWEDRKWKLALGGVGFLVFMWLTWGWWFHGDDDEPEA